MSTKDKKTTVDVLVVGAGPVGLCMALAVSQLGLSCMVVEKQPEDRVEKPADDGRETALTHRSVAVLRATGVWPAIEKHPLGQIKTAHVLNKRGQQPLSFAAAGTGKDRLSYMVPNHVIRRAAYDTLCAAGTAVEMSFGAGVIDASFSDDGATATLENGRYVQARLIVAADSRFSPLRGMAGIETETLDFKKTMILCKMKHQKPHHSCAYEWFQHERTLAILPLAGAYASAVLTVSADQAQELLQLDEQQYATKISEWFEHKHGAMQVVGKRHSYPLSAVYAKKFWGPSMILAGDAAVGMHPVTAHGFNFGLRSVESMTKIIRDAQARGHDYAAPHLLKHYHRQHRLATRPLYLATNAIATLFTRQGPVSGLLRHGLHTMARRVPFARRVISRQLVDTAK